MYTIKATTAGHEVKTTVKDTSTGMFLAVDVLTRDFLNGKLWYNSVRCKFLVKEMIIDVYDSDERVVIHVNLRSKDEV